MHYTGFKYIGSRKRIKVIPCERVFNSNSVLSSRNERVNSLLPEFAAPRSTLTITKSYSRTIGNSLI